MNLLKRRAGIFAKKFSRTKSLNIKKAWDNGRFGELEFLVTRRRIAQKSRGFWMLTVKGTLDQRAFVTTVYFFIKFF